MKSLIGSCSSGIEFWRVIKSISGSKSCINRITRDDWNIYFRELLNCKNNVEKQFEKDVTDYVKWHDENCLDCVLNVNDNDVNRNISMGEVESAVMELVSSKAPGIDGINNDILKNGKNVIVPLMCEVFNKILETGEYPAVWGNAIIVPIHKKGNVNNPCNYRGIALLSCISKVFMKIINKRLTR